MSRDEIRNAVADIVGAYSRLVTDRDWSRNLVELGVNSLQTMELVMTIEARFGIVFEDDELNADNLSSADSLCSMIERALLHGQLPFSADAGEG